MLIDEKGLFATSDMPLTATLLCFGAVLEFVDWRDQSRAIFYIRREKGLDGIVQEYWAGKLKVEPQAYFAALKAVKARLYDRSSYGDIR